MPSAVKQVLGTLFSLEEWQGLFGRMLDEKLHVEK